MWYGKGSTGDEREMAKKIAAVIAPGEQEIVYEGTSNSASNLRLLWWWIWGHWYWCNTV